ncbi:MAG: ATP-grasp domain-containing protein [Clostridiaceae bacterium]|nr:ATP-grasp domain-containing protein [Clostridiaceae bacterium]
MKKIVIIGANYFQNPLIKKAKEMGFETHVFAWKDGAVGEKTADYFYPISIIEKEKILDECRKIKPDAITTIASDLATITVNYVANKLNLPSNSLECTSISTNKFKMREAFKANKIPTPNFLITDNTSPSISKLHFPIIIKPTDRSGSRAITKLYDDKNLKSAISNAINNSFEKKAIIEEYIDGNEYSCECISFKGQHHFLTITKKFTTGSPHFIETGHMQPCDLSDDVQKKVKNTIFKALNALKITNGASHSEFKITPEGNIRIIEIGARMGGDCIGSDLVQLSTGYDFLKMVIDTACGKYPDFNKTLEPKISIIRFIFNKKDLELLDKIKKHNPNSIYFISEIEDINSRQVTDSSSRFGYFILTYANPKEAKEVMDL